MILLRPVFIQLFQAVSAEIVRICGFLPIPALTCQTIHRIITVGYRQIRQTFTGKYAFPRFQGSVSVQVIFIP